MNDLERVTKSAYGMIAYAGMNDKLPNIYIGAMNLYRMGINYLYDSQVPDTVAAE